MRTWQKIVFSVSAFVLVIASLFFGLSHLLSIDIPQIPAQVPAPIDINSLTVPTSIQEQRVFWKELIETYGGIEAYRIFSLVHDEQNPESHKFAHVFGEALYEVVGLEGVKVCDIKFRFGCYHSFFAIAIHHKGIEMLPVLDGLCREEYGEADTRCQHGLGHGLLVYTGYENLLQAVELCASLPSWQITGSCAGGVFMEYNFHTMEEVEGKTYLRELTDDIYEPCSTLPEKYQPACYNEQVQWWLSVFDNDLKYVGDLCSTLKDNQVTWESCYGRVGNFVTETVGADYDAIVATCDQMENELASYLCREGSIFPMTGVPSMRDTRLRICETLTGYAKERCIKFVDYWER